MNVCQMLVERQLGPGSATNKCPFRPARCRNAGRLDARILRQLLLSEERAFLPDGRPWRGGQLMYEQGKIFLRSANTARNGRGGGAEAGQGELMCFQANPPPVRRSKTASSGRTGRERRCHLYSIVGE